MWFRGETDCRCCGGGGAMVAEKGKRERERERAANRGTHKENISPKPLAGKTRRTDFKFLQPVGFKD